eukprot:1161696-Pelagomonas_calceolata.AAC.18
MSETFKVSQTFWLWMNPFIQLLAILIIIVVHAYGSWRRVLNCQFQQRVSAHLMCAFLVSYVYFRKAKQGTSFLPNAGAGVPSPEVPFRSTLAAYHHPCWQCCGLPDHHSASISLRPNQKEKGRCHHRCAREV